MRRKRMMALLSAVLLTPLTTGASASFLVETSAAVEVPAMVETEHVAEVPAAIEVEPIIRKLNQAGTPETRLPAMPTNTIGTAAEVLEIDPASETMIVKTDIYNRLVLRCSKDTLWMDTQSGVPVLESEVAVGDKIYIYHDDCMTVSEPPQTKAQAILTNLDEQHAPAQLLTVESLKRNSDGSIRVLANNSSIYVTLPADIPISPLQTRNIVSLDDIQLGTRFFAWYDQVAMSLPGQATAYRAVLPMQNDYTFPIAADGQEEAVSEGHIFDSVAVVPIRAVAESLGYTVTWNQEKKIVSLVKGDVRIMIQVGEDQYTQTQNGAIQAVSFGTAMVNDNGRCWVPAEMFARIGETVHFGGGVLSIGGTSLPDFD